MYSITFLMLNTTLVRNAIEQSGKKSKHTNLYLCVAMFPWLLESRTSFLFVVLRRFISQDLPWWPKRGKLRHVAASVLEASTRQPDTKM